MKKYTVQLDDDTAEFFEGIAHIAKRPVEEVLSSSLFKQVEMIDRAVNKQENKKTKRAEYVACCGMKPYLYDDGY